MKNKALHFMAAAVLSSALLMTGCGSHSGDTNSSTKQTQDQTQRGAGQDSAQTSARRRIAPAFSGSANKPTTSSFSLYTAAA